MKIELYHTTEELKRLFRQEKDSRISTRIRAVYLAQMDKTAPQIANGYDHMRQVANESWHKVCLYPEKIKSICRAKYIEDAVF